MGSIPELSGCARVAVWGSMSELCGSARVGGWGVC